MLGLWTWLWGAITQATEGTFLSQVFAQEVAPVYSESTVALHADKISTCVTCRESAAEFRVVGAICRSFVSERSQNTPVANQEQAWHLKSVSLQ